jgi:hypothetical protein
MLALTTPLAAGGENAALERVEPRNMNVMKTTTLSRWLGALALGGWAASLAAQTMPQDNWRYNQHQFTGPDPSEEFRSIAIGAGGVYVGRGNPATAILQFQENGVLIRQFGTFGAIRGLACDSAGNVYALDAGDSTIKAFDKDGSALRQWGSAGTNDGQFGFTVDATTLLAIDSNDQIYVADQGNTRVQVFNAQGGFLRKWGGAGSLPGQFPADNPRAIAANPNGWIYVNIYVKNYGPYDTRIFDSSGNFIKSIPLRDSLEPSTLAISPDGVLLHYTRDGVGDGWLDFYDMNTKLLYPRYRAPFYYYQGRGAAFSKRGDVFAVVGQSVSIYEREYSSVQNPPTPPAIPLPIVLNVSQRTNTAWLDVDFKVVHAEASNVTAGALAFINGGNALSNAVLMTTFMENTAANLGTNVPANTNLQITWNMGADWSIDYAQIQVEVLAKDNRNLMGFHWITVPSDGTNAAMQVSSAPVPELELLSVWYWFIATHNPGIAFSSGTVTGVGGAYTGQLLANDSGTTSLGRAFAYERMNVRAITAAEITRANAGRYGFTSVDANSVVKLP